MLIPSELSSVVNIGNVPNDGTGDDLRTAFVKINGAFNFVGQNFGYPTTVVNIGSQGQGLFKEKVNGELRFKKLDATDNLTITAVGDSLVVKFVPGDNVIFDEITATKVTSNLEGNVTGNLTGQVLTASQPNITEIGTLTNLTVTNPISANLAGNVTGNLTGNVTGNVAGNLTGLIRTSTNESYIDVSASFNSIENRINNFDFGLISPINTYTDSTRSFRSPHLYILYAVGVDLGTINNPSDFGIEAGAI